MTFYELYWNGDEFIGILPERRKNSERVTPESVINWGRKVLGSQGTLKGIYFKRITIENGKGRI
jgi:hypothetical protein